MSGSGGAGGTGAPAPSASRRVAISCRVRLTPYVTTRPGAAQRLRGSGARPGAGAGRPAARLGRELHRLVRDGLQQVIERRRREAGGGQREPELEAVPVLDEPADPGALQV